MAKIKILFLLIVVLIETSANRTEPPLESQHLPRTRLRTLGIYALKALSNLAKSYEIKKKLEDEIKKQEMMSKNEK
jgi:hypothetical protein